MWPGNLTRDMKLHLNVLRDVGVLLKLLCFWFSVLSCLLKSLNDTGGVLDKGTKYKSFLYRKLDYSGSTQSVIVSLVDKWLFVCSRADTKDNSCVLVEQT